MLKFVKLLISFFQPTPNEPTPHNEPKPFRIPIRDLDFMDVKMKLMEAEPEGKGWTVDQAEEAEKWYRRFLQVCRDYPKLATVPNGPIDLFWHQHILDTRAYARDCQAVFGHFVHHYPYFGLKGDADVRDVSFGETNAIYRHEFGEDCTEMKFFKRKTEAIACMTDVQPCATKCATCSTEEIKASACGATCDSSSNCGGEQSIRSACSNAPCTTSACKSGCKTCTVDRRQEGGVVVGSGCNGGGSGTGCGQRCGRN